MMIKTIARIFVILILLSVAVLSVNAQVQTHEYRKNLTISHVNAAGATLLNNTYFINVTKEPAMHYDFSDLRFYDASLNELDYEQESYTEDYALIWLRVPLLVTTGTSVWMYYNGSEVLGEDTKNTWEPAAKMVQHLQESPINKCEGHLDSTQYGNHGTPKDFNETLGTTTNASGRIDGADLFNGKAGYPYLAGVSCGANESTNITGNITLEAWVKAEITDELQSIVGKYYPWGSKEGYHICTEADMFAAYITDADGTERSLGLGPLNTDTWQHVVVTKNNTRICGYVNGVEQNVGISGIGIKSADTATRTYHVGIGRYSMGSSYPFDGTIDEVRIYDRALSADEIKQSYEMVKNQSTCTLWGAAENLQKCGDVDCNDLVNVLDATKVKNRAGNPAYFINNEWSADVNCDSAINVLDATKVKNHAGNPSHILDCCII